MEKRIHYYAGPVQLVDALYNGIAGLSARCLEQRGCFSVVLAGGSTPQPLYRRLRHFATDWQRWHIYFGDERWLPVGDPGRNDAMAAAAWLDHVPIPSQQVHRIAPGTSVVDAAAAYAAVLEHARGFDLALLGLGEDGHTASLFPGDPLVGQGDTLAIAVTNAPKPPAQRVSMSARCLSSAAAVWYMVTGPGKREALESWLGGAQLPPEHIRPRNGIDVFTDITLPGELRRRSREACP
ncbi:MAG: 6-phosphogluconolactonase [Halioglobus sp.]